MTTKSEYVYEVQVRYDESVSWGRVATSATRISAKKTLDWYRGRFPLAHFRMKKLPPYLEGE
jgi:hypothetical protein